MILVKFIQFSFEKKQFSNNSVINRKVVLNFNSINELRNSKKKNNFYQTSNLLLISVYYVYHI